MNNINIRIRTSQVTEIDIEDIIQSLKKLNILDRWPVVAELLNSINIEDRNTLSKKHKEIINDYLSNKAKWFIE